MADLTWHEGSIESLEEPRGNSKTWRVEVLKAGNEYTKKFQIWPNAYQSEDINPAFLTLKAAKAEGKNVKVGFTTKQVKGPKGTYPENTIYEVDVVDGGGEASWSAPQESGWEVPAEVSSAAAAPSSPSSNTTNETEVARKQTVNMAVHTLRELANALEAAV